MPSPARQPAEIFPQERWFGRAAFAMLALTPLVVDSKAWDDAYMAPKWAWVAAWSGLGLALLFSRMVTGRPVIFPIQKLAFALLAWTVWHWIAAIWAESKGLAIDRALRMTWLFVAVLMGLQWLKRRRALVLVAWLWIAVATITAAWVLYEDAVRAWHPALVRIRPNLPDWRGFLAGGLGNTNHLGDLLALAMIPAMIMFGEARRRRAMLTLFIALLLLAAALIVCYSVGSNLGLILASLLMLVFVVTRFGISWFLRRKSRWALLFACWAGLILFFNVDIAANPHRPGILKEGFGSERWKEGGPTRLVIWAQTWELIKTNPILGAGTGNFTYAYPEMRSPLVQRRPELLAYQGSWTNAAHNELLQTWAELGIIGLILFLTVTLFAYYSLIRGLRHAGRLNFLVRVALAALLTAWLGHAQMNFALQHPAGALAFHAILFAILLEHRTRSKDRPMPSLVNEWGPFEFRVEWASMREPTGLGAALPLSGRAVGFSLAGVMLIGLGWMVHGSRPVVAQREYRRAMEAVQQGDAEAANNHFVEALAIDPAAVDVRSRYSDLLIRAWAAPKPGLDQLALVRKRLNSTELYLREAHALRQLGQTEEADRLMAEYAKRVPTPPREKSTP